MKFSVKTVFFIFLLILTLFADNIIRELTVVPSESSIEITFVTENEIGVREFNIQRSVGDDNLFQDIKKIYPKGVPSTYTYIDEWSFASKLSTTTVYYRIRIVFDNGTESFSEKVIVVPKVNEIIKSWGSIKLLFR